jgi:predicted aldo/keto reductase-like oxidoreductase
MQYTNLGRTGLQVSRLCLGTMNFGPFTTEEDSYAIMDKALELGINFFASLRAEVHRAQAQAADFKAGTAKIRVLHDSFLSQ